MLRVEKTVFLSYRRRDFPWALAIYTHLTHSGYDVFFDYLGIASGDFESIILENIRARAHFLALLTPSALDRCSEPGDWLRREIEEAMECRRNIVPLFVDGFNFSASSIATHLTGRLAAFIQYNGLGVPAEYFAAAMDRLSEKFLNVPLEAVLHPASNLALEAAKGQQIAASMDSLTGLINRREFETRLERAIKNTKARNLQYAVCYLDLDQFQMIKESFGYSAADTLLNQTGELLKSKMLARDTLARLSDQFGVLLENCGPDEAVLAARRLRGTVCNSRFSWKGNSLQLSATIGVAAVSIDHDSVDSVITAAVSACHTAKETGRDRVRGFMENDIEIMRRRREMQWATKLDTALSQGRFELSRLIIHPLQKAEIGARYELLLRFREENGDIVSPDQFQSAADLHNISPMIDRWVVENAFIWLASNREERARLLQCSINVSRPALADEKFLQFVIERLEHTGIEGSKICFEFNESTVVDSGSLVIRFVQALSERGCKFAIDEWGTGLSSFGYLKSFPAHFLKIDRSFVREILRDPIDREMVRSFAEIGRLTGKQTIAEFTESADIADKLREMGIDYAQGSAFSRPERIAGIG